MIRKLAFVLAALIGASAYAVTVPVTSTDQTITPHVTACFNFAGSPPAYTTDSNGTYKCVAGKWERWDIHPCPANPPTGAAPGGANGNTVCRRTDTGGLYGADGSGNWASLSGSGATVAGATDGLVQIKSGSSLTTAPGFSADSTTGAVEAKSLNGTVYANKYATAGTGAVGSQWTSPTGTGGIQEAATALGAQGGTIKLTKGYYKVTAMTSLPSNVVIEGDGVTASIIVADAAFSGAAILRWINPVSDNTFAGSLVTGVGGRNFSIDGNGVNAHGINVIRGYDGVTFDTIDVTNVGDTASAFKFEPNPSYAAGTVSQTIVLINTLGIHKNGGAGVTGAVYSFEGVQEMSLLNAKGFGGPSVSALVNADIFKFINCKGVNASGISMAGTGANAVHVLSTGTGNLQSRGLYFYGTTIEASTTSVRIEGNGTTDAQLVHFYGIRPQTGTWGGSAVTAGPIVMLDAHQAYIDAFGFSVTVDANSQDVELKLADIADLTSDAGTRTRVIAKYANAKNWLQPALRGSLGLFPEDATGPTVLFGQASRADNWRVFWSASSGAEFGLQTRYTTSGGTSLRASIAETDGDWFFYNADTLALSIQNLRTSPVIFGTPKGTTPPLTCSSGDLFYDTDATAGQRLLVCNTANQFVVQGDGGGNFLVNGAVVSSPNLASGTKVNFSVAGSNITPGIVAGSIPGTDLTAAAGILQTQLATFDSSDLAGRLNDETGSAGGFVRATAPTISGPTITGLTPTRDLQVDAFGNMVAVPIASGGSVTSVGVSAPATEITVTNSPVTTNGTIALTWTAQLANRFFAGAASGGSSTPTFRFLAPADCATAVFNGTAGTTGCVPPPSAGDISSGFFLKANGTYAAAAGLATTGSPAITQFARFGASGLSLNGLAGATLDDSANATFNSLSTATPANGSRRIKGVGNTSDPAAPANTDWLLYGKSASLTDGLQLPFWRNAASGVIRILNDYGGDYGFFTCAAGTCTQDINTVDGTHIALASQVIGDMSWYNGTDWVRLAPGTVGQILQTNAGAVPTWVTNTVATSNNATFVMNGIATGDTGIVHIPAASTVTRIACYTVGGATSVATVNVNKRAQATPATSGTDVTTTAYTCDTTTVNTAQTINSAAITAGNWLALTFGTVTGTANLVVSVDYTTP